MSESDFLRVAGIAKVRIGVDLRTLNKAEEAQQSIDEGSEALKASGAPIVPSELVQLLTQKKTKPR